LRQHTLKKVTESQITAQILDYLRWALPGAWIRKNLGTLGQRRGIPDIEVIYEGIPYFLEVKTPIGKLSKYQEIEITALREAGVLVYVVRSLEEVHEIFRGKGKEISLGGVKSRGSDPCTGPSSQVDSQLKEEYSGS